MAKAQPSTRRPSSATELELLVQRIQAQLAPSAEILHNVRLAGRRSGVQRQIDVLMHQRVGQYDIRIVIDCKDYQRPVDVKAVEEFYGLLDDVGGHKGVLVCPRGFTEAAKARAKDYQIDLYSPVDTDPHKWQAQASIPALCDFRMAAVSFGIRGSAPAPLTLPPDFYRSRTAYNEAGVALGTALEVLAQRWNDGDLPFDLGETERFDIFAGEVTLIDNGHGMRVPVELNAQLCITRQLYFGQLPIQQISGFRDECSGDVITNAFSVGLLDPDQIESEWEAIADESEATVKPVIQLQGVVCIGVG